MRLHVLLATLLLSAACNADPLTRDEEAARPSDAGLDAGETNLSRDGGQERDAARLPDSALADAPQVAEASALVDGGSPADAGPVCALDASLISDASTCASQLCSASGGPWLRVHADEPWDVGGLDWVLTVCARSAGWPRARSSDGRDLGYRLSAQDVAQIQAGAPVQVAWGSPSSGDATRSKPCSSLASEPLSMCPFEGSCTSERKAEIAALPPRPECLPCSADAGIDPCFGAGSCACWCGTRTWLQDACPDLLP